MYIPIYIHLRFHICIHNNSFYIHIRFHIYIHVFLHVFIQRYDHIIVALTYSYVCIRIFVFIIKLCMYL